MNRLTAEYERLKKDGLCLCSNSLKRMAIINIVRTLSFEEADRVFKELEIAMAFMPKENQNGS